ncbi:MAG: hypothetical protein A2091_12510 [Desulfuromonadales bacterium GWD2_61_12]|nr:MAG: hypothetical protein A2005_02980 [Desulfuromonadales bacterium GWC2_61_20]OGR33152.1 MAG: hypothetical protein A2091_12510 [Desulfuromonadales bacterium GWD2_61_12]HAD03719.1 hypothetical protein [Desulfuromonas sp.]
MERKGNRFVRLLAASTFILMLLACVAPALAGEYTALTGVKGLDSVFDVSLGSPAKASVIFPAVKDVYENKEVRALPAPPRTVIVFHGPAVKLISSARKGVDKEDLMALDKVAEMIRQFKKDGVKMEVCMYAVKVMGVDPATLMPEIDRVGNGFISVLAYQAQGYAVVTVP